jgi:hypothetical protein
MPCPSLPPETLGQIKCDIRSEYYTVKDRKTNSMTKRKERETQGTKESDRKKRTPEKERNIINV